MDPNANLDAQRALVAEANAIQDRWSDGSPPPSVARRLQEIAIELAALVEALDDWRAAGGFDPYAAPPDQDALTVTRLLMAAFGVGGLSHAYCLAQAMRDGQPVLIFCERTGDGLTPMAEIIPPRARYTPGSPAGT